MRIPLWFKALPRPFRRRFYTRALGYAPTELAGLVFRIAETRIELTQAFQLLHDVSVQRGIYVAKPNRMRVMPCHAMPSTAVFVAMHRDEVVSTVTLVEDSVLGLPMESVFPDEVNRFRLRRCSLAEVSALATRKDFRGTGVTMTMTRMLWRWAYFYRRITDLVIAMRPSMADYYRTVLLFEPIGGERSYSSLNNTRVVPMHLDLQTTVERYAKAYGEKAQPGLRNLYRFMFLERDATAVKLPLRMNHIWVTSNDVPSLTPADLLYFFVEQDDVLGALDETRLRYLDGLYPEYGLYDAVVAARRDRAADAAAAGSAP